MKGQISHYYSEIFNGKVSEYKNYCEIKRDTSWRWYNILNDDLSWDLNRTFILDKEDVSKYYSNLLMTIIISKTVVSVSEENDKIRLNISVYNSHRYRGRRFFRVRKHSTTLTYNLRTKNFYITNIIKQKKRILSKDIRVNDFGRSFLSKIKGKFGGIDKISKEDGEIRDKVSRESIQIFFQLMSDRTKIPLFVNRNQDNEIFRLYLTHNEFKYPDNYFQYKKIKLSKKGLKKKSLVRYLMELNNLRGKKIRKVLNTFEDFEMDKLIFLYRLFGGDYFNRLNDSTLKQVLKPSDYSSWKLSTKELGLTLDNNEKRGITDALNKGAQFEEVMDLWAAVKELNVKYDHKIRFKITTLDQFRDELFRVKQILFNYKNGRIEREYPTGLQEKIEEKIHSNGEDFYPILLLNSHDFNSEAYIQSNCLARYTKTAKSIIISLRKGDPNNQDRGSVEYQIKNERCRFTNFI